MLPRIAGPKCGRVSVRLRLRAPMLFCVCLRAGVATALRPTCFTGEFLVKHWAISRVDLHRSLRFVFSLWRALTVLETAAKNGEPNVGSRAGSVMARRPTTLFHRGVSCETLSHIRAELSPQCIAFSASLRVCVACAPGTYGCARLCFTFFCETLSQMSG